MWRKKGVEESVHFYGNGWCREKRDIYALKPFGQQNFKVMVVFIIESGKRK